ncbi:MAG: 4-hydroxy-tetrahydrodipicolinate synthase [Alphaproteobacteria bacterium]|nr:4-hydroxy-tetrahydrodipicolinate synthase [Alphaproteobacteria bacterium]MDB5740896.1 4-hydroxy-tetrahydrodipicolinate synthase [Alphaproteobacteria bacterium]
MTIRDRIKGSIPALITPMKDGKVDEAAFRALVQWQIAEGSTGLVPTGTTGESPTLSHEEHMRVVEICVEEAAGRVPVIAGAGSNSTDEAIALTKHAKEVGCDAVLSVTGYYNKPSQEGQYRHFMAIAEAVDIPILLYNIPGRAIVEISVETMARLAKNRNIIGVKDATANLMRPSRERNAIGKDWLLISGEDGTALGYNAHGGHGCISVTANVAPRLCAEFQAASLSGDFAKAREYQDKLMPLHDAMFCEPSPAPAKFGVSLLGRCLPDVRLPLVEATDAARAQVKAAMQGAGLKF